MNDFAARVADWWKLSAETANLGARRWVAAQQAITDSVRDAVVESAQPPVDGSSTPWDAWWSYTVDACQRSVLFWDTIRRRGNVFIEHERAGLPPVLIYDYEVIVDGQKLDRPVNYSLVRILPPEGIEVDDTMRPYLIVDPRAGHGPGIGGFKEDSQVGVALRAGHPVYFVIFGPVPFAGQTIEDVIRAKAPFIQAVIERHPGSPKPAIVGNCQGGWATMMLAAARPDLVGPLVINGAPMSYWSGHLEEGPGKNPMRYLGGLCGGSWSALWGSDLGNGKFDGAHLVQNFESLNPANTYWDKYYHLYANIDTEPPRFLEFERWWGGFVMLNEAEMRDIVNQLFIGNRLARGEIKSQQGQFLDLKEIRAPIVVFSSFGDNITPPQQALNWIADIYSSTAEIKANNQVIVALTHETVGHLGIFVSGKVANREHSAIFEVLEHLEHLDPGFYLMEIFERRGADGEISFEVAFDECQLEDLREVNRLDRWDEDPFELVAQISGANETMYQLMVRPWVRALVNEPLAEAARFLHPMRSQRWMFSDWNPTLWNLPAMAKAVAANRRPCAADNVFCRAETAVAATISASLSCYRDLRDAARECLFFQTYGGMIAAGIATTSANELEPRSVDIRDLPFVRQSLEDIERGGYPAALARVAALIGHRPGPIRLEDLRFVDELVTADKALSRLTEDDIRHLRGEQLLIAALEPDRALSTLPKLLADSADRQRVLDLLERLPSLREELSAEQRAAIKQIEVVLQGREPWPNHSEFLTLAT